MKTDIIFKNIKEFRQQLEKAITHIQDKQDPEYKDYHARRLVDMAADIIISYLLCISALKSKRKKIIASQYILKAKFRIKANLDYILSDDRSLIENHLKIIESEKN